MHGRWGTLIAVSCLVLVCAPSWVAAQSVAGAPGGVRRNAPRLSGPPEAPDTPATLASDSSAAAPAKTTASSTVESGQRSGDESSAVIHGRQIPYPTSPKHGQDAVAALRAVIHDPPVQHQVPQEAWPISHDESATESAWVATHPDPGEPLGFSGAMAKPAVPFDPSAASGFFDEQYEAIHEPMDPDAPAPAVSSGEWLRDGYWYSKQSAVYIMPSVGPKNDVILATDLQGAILPEFNPRLTIPTDNGWAPGWRSVVGRRIGRDCRNRDHAIEVTFLGLTHWGVAGGLESLTGGGIFTDIDPTFSVPAFNASRFQTFDLTSEFNSFEVNYRIERRLSRDRLIYTRDSTWVRQATPALLPSIFAGIRWAAIDERLFWYAESDNPVSTGSYLQRTTNRMVGPQIGGDLFYERSDWRIGVRAKAAAVVNWSSQSADVRILNANGDPLIPNRDEFAKSHDGAFLGELNFIGLYHLQPHLALRFSYDLMWASNLALAQNQLTFNPGLPAELANSNTLFFQGLAFGLELVR